MSSPNLPPLPEPDYSGAREDYFSEDTVRAYGAACVAAEREACAAICEADECDFLARAIRARGET